MQFQALWTRFILVLGTFFLLVGVASGQATRGKGVILGVVQDQTGGFMPGVEVTITDLGQGLARTVVSGDTGNYRLGNLNPGEYEIRASLSGFETAVLSGIVLQAAQVARIPITLNVGEVTTEVIVEGATAPIIETDHASIGEVIDATKVRELPLNGRDFMQLATLVPGAVFNTQDQVGVFEQTGSSISVNGIGPQSTNVMLDGIQNTEFGAGRLAFTPSIDLIQEFQVVTNVYDAEFGGTPAAQINLVSKRGTLGYHGSAFYFRRSNDNDARNFFQIGELPAFEREQFGGSFGGNIPGSEKDFLFFVYEGQRQQRGLTLPASVPTDAIRIGDFSGTGTTIYDPLTADPVTGLRQPFPGNIIPADRITPQAEYIRTLWPSPTGPGIAGNFSANPNRVRDFTQWSIRYDRDFSDTDSIMFRYTRNVNQYLEPAPRNFTLPVDGFRQNQKFVGPNYKGGWTHTFGPTTINSLNIGFSEFRQCRDHETTDPGLFGCGGPYGPLTGVEFFQKSGIIGVSQAGQEADIPRLLVSGFSDIATSTFAPVTSNEPHWQINNTFSRIQGNHSWKAGIDVLDSYFPLAFEARTSGRIRFTPRFTTAEVGGPGDEFNAFGDFLLGTVQSSTIFQNQLFMEVELEWWSFFVQDDWTVHPDLTINLGVRYEIFKRPVEREDRVVAFDINTEQFVFPGSVPTLPGTPPNSAVAETLGYSRTLQHDTDKNDFGPRVGFAYRIGGDNKTVLRGGTGVFYTWFVEDMQVGQGFGPPFVQIASNSSDPDRPAATFEDPFTSEGVATANPGQIAINDNNTGYLYQYSLSLDRELSPNLGVEVAYVGNAARKMLRSHNFNQAVPGPEPLQERRERPQFGNLSGRVSWANAHYDALQVKMRKEMGPEGLLALVSYTWSKANGHVVPGAAFRQQPNRDQRNWKEDWGPTVWSIDQILSLSWVYELPFGTGKALGGDMSRGANLALGGWKFGGIANFQTGTHFTVNDSFNTSNSGSSRPDMIGNTSRSHSTQDAKIAEFFNTNAFQRAPAFTFGNTGTGTVEGPSLQIWDLSLYKDFHITEKYRAQFRVEFFNAFNHTNFFNPGATFGTGSFGVITRSRDARQIQFGLRFDF